nr:hypothetical protein [Tanacetum cinerariifolium]
IIMANIPPNDPNVGASAIIPAPVNPDHAPAQPVGLGNEEEDPEEDDDDVMEIDDEAEVIEPYMDDGSNNPPPPNYKDEETPPTSPVIPDADEILILFRPPMYPNLRTTWKRLGKMEKLISKRINIEGRMKKKFKEQDRYFVGIGCGNIEMDRTIIMANIPPNDPNVDASAIIPAPVNPDHAPAQLVGLGNGFVPHWIGDNIPNNQNGWIEEEAEEEEEDP